MEEYFEEIAAVAVEIDDAVEDEEGEVCRLPWASKAGGTGGRVPPSDKFRRGRPPRIENEVVQIR